MSPSRKHKAVESKMKQGYVNALIACGASVTFIAMSAVASYSVIQAASSSDTSGQRTMSLISDQPVPTIAKSSSTSSPAPTLFPSVSPSPSPSASLTPMAVASSSASSVPATPKPTQTKKPTVTPTGTASTVSPVASQSPTPKPAPTSPTPNPTPTPTSPPVPIVTYVSSEQAQAMVVGAAHGTVLSSTEDVVAGRKVWVVTMERPDKSVIAGIVDAYTGVVTGWAVIKEAPTATPQPDPTPAAQVVTPQPSETPSGHEGDEHGDDDSVGATPQPSETHSESPGGHGPNEDD